MFSKINGALILITIFQHSLGISLEEFTTLSHNEKQILVEFKNLVSSRLPHDYMRKDIYLISWLREVDFNISAAEEMIMNMVQWREETKMDQVMYEDFSYFEQMYKGNIEGCDYEGRPVLSIYIADYDIRRAIISGQFDKLRRYADRIFEEATKMLREMQADGQNVTQIVMIFDLNNINVVSHACPLCISLYLHIVGTLQTRYPGYIHKIMTVNTPQFAIPIWNGVKNLVTRKLTDILKIYGKNKSEWQHALFKETDPSQISQHLGGTRSEALDYHEFLRNGKTVFRCTDNLNDLIQ